MCVLYQIHYIRSASFFKMKDKPGYTLYSNRRTNYTAEAAAVQ